MMLVSIAIFATCDPILTLEAGDVAKKAPYETIVGHPTNDIEELLFCFAKTIGIRTVDFQENVAAMRFIQYWSEGKLGKLILEDDLSQEAYVSTLKTKNDALRDYSVARTRQGDRLRKKFLYR
jgi:hypothetical protein